MLIFEQYTSHCIQVFRKDNPAQQLKVLEGELHYKPVIFSKPNAAGLGKYGWVWECWPDTYLSTDDNIELARYRLTLKPPCKAYIQEETT